MITKILPLKYPPITTQPMETDYLAIILNYKEAWPWFYNYFIQLAAFKIPDQNKEHHILKLWDGACFRTCPFINTQIIERRFVKYKWDTIISFIMDCVNANYYIYINLDNYYFSFSSKYHDRKHFIHPTLIYGYDNEKKIIFVADFYDNQKYAFKEATFTEIENAFSNDYVEEHMHHAERIFLLHYNKFNYKFNVKLVRTFFKEYLLSKNSFSACEILFNNPFSSQFFYGLSCYDFCNHFIDLIIQKKYTFLDVRHFYNLWTHKAAVLRRIKYLGENNYLKNYNILYNLYKEVEKAASKIHYIFLLYRKKRNDVSLKQIKIKIYQLKIKEKRIIKKILKNLIISSK